MSEKRFRMEIIEGATLPFIVDNSTAKKQNDKITSYKTYETHRKDKCLELVNLLNELNDENKQLKEEKELLKNKLDRIEDILPHYLSCAEINEFRSKPFKEDIALMKCWNKRYQK